MIASEDKSQDDELEPEGGEFERTVARGGKDMGEGRLGDSNNGIRFGIPKILDRREKQAFVISLEQCVPLPLVLVYLYWHGGR